MSKHSFTIEKHGTHSFLNYCVMPEENLDSTSLGMLTNNKIPGLATTIYTQMDTMKYIKYNISSKIPLKQILEGKINKKRILGIFSGIIDAMISTEEYMLDMETILLDKDYIFVDISTYETVLICLPIISNQRERFDLRVFLKEIMMSIQFDATEDCSYVAKVMNYLNSAPVFSLEAFSALLSEIRNEVKINISERKNEAHSHNLHAKRLENESQINAHQSEMATLNEEEKEEFIEINEKQISLFYLLQHYNKENAAIYKAQNAARKKTKEISKAKGKKQENCKKDNVSNSIDIGLDFAIPGQSVEHEISSSVQQAVHSQVNPQSKLEIVQQKEFTPQVISREMDFGSTVILDDEDENTIYIDSMEEETLIRSCLVRQKTGERIDIDKAMFRIGRDRKVSDYQISDNQAVGRNHAYIELRDGEYFVVDMNSKNNTYVNGIKIKSGTAVKLTHGDIVKFANDEFEFLIN